MQRGELGQLGTQLIGDLAPLRLAASASSWAKAVAMKAETTRRPLLPACASTLRMKWTRQRCQVAFSTLATAALMPSWASEMTSLTPRRPRRASLRRNSVQNVSASEGPMSMPSTSRRPSLLTPTATITATETMRPLLAHLHVGRVDPQIRPVALDRAVEEGLHLLVDLLAQPADLALGDAGHAHRLDQIIDRAGRDALDVGFLHHGGQRLLGQPARLQEARKVAALAQLRDAQLDRAGARLPDPVAVAVALDKPLGALLAIAGAGQALDLQLHQPLRRQSRSSRATDRRRGSSPQAREGSSSHRSSVVPRFRLVFATRPYRRIRR